jgi:hypothetical protein
MLTTHAADDERLDAQYQNGDTILRKSNINRTLARCTQCGYGYRAGELSCSSCGFVFSSSGKTGILAHKTHNQPRPTSPTGRVTASINTQVALCAEQGEFILPDHDVVIIGRSNPGDPSPDVDLTPLDALEQGVSRHHIRITRHRNVFVICDVGSSNGTLLNGKLLLPSQETLLHDGDDLRLGDLKLKVKFRA